MFMFAVLFGLSMDYEVFLLSRIRGIASPARVITSAALVIDLRRGLRFP